MSSYPHYSNKEKKHPRKPLGEKKHQKAISKRKAHDESYYRINDYKGPEMLKEAKIKKFLKKLKESFKGKKPTKSDKWKKLREAADIPKEYKEGLGAGALIGGGSGFAIGARWEKKKSKKIDKKAALIKYLRNN